MLVILMGKVTDTFIAYQTIQYVANFPNPSYSERAIFYEENLKNISLPQNATLYLSKVDEFYNAYKHNFSVLANASEIRFKLAYSVVHVVDIYDDGVFKNGTLYVDIFKHDSGMWCLYMGLTTLGFVICNYFAVSMFAQAAKNQVYQIKLLFFRSIIHQDISWFDTKSSGDFASKITG